MVIRVDNTTDLSIQDEKGERYTANFEFYPFHEGQSYALYKGILNGDSFTQDRHGQKCVVRSFSGKTAESGTEWLQYLKIAEKARELSISFNKKIGRTILCFPSPLLTTIDQKSSFIGLFRKFNPHQKRLKASEVVVLEPFLHGDFQQYYEFKLGKATPVSTQDNPIKINSNKASHKKACKSKESRKSSLPLEGKGCSDEISIALGAFTHFTWHMTKRLIVSDLQGTYKEKSFSLVNPTIHSTDSSYGSSDRGQVGIQEFFDHHVCHEDWCSTWSKYFDHSTKSLEKFSSLIHQPD